MILDERSRSLQTSSALDSRCESSPFLPLLISLKGELLLLNALIPICLTYEIVLLLISKAVLATETFVRDIQPEWWSQVGGIYR